MEWGKRGDFIVRGRLPFNAEPPGPVLADGEITAMDAFYCRNNGPFPDIVPQQWSLTVDGMVDKPLAVTYEQLTTRFTARSVVATGKIQPPKSRSTIFSARKLNELPAC